MSETSLAPAKRGPPRGNVNAIRNGTHLSHDYRLVIGSLPRKWRKIERAARKYREDLEREVRGRHGSVSVLHAHDIDAAVAWNMHAGICLWLLRERLPTMSDADVTACSKQHAWARQQRNLLVKQLRIDPPAESDTFAMLYATPPEDASVPGPPAGRQTRRRGRTASESTEGSGARETAASERPDGTDVHQVDKPTPPGGPGSAEVDSGAKNHSVDPPAATSRDRVDPEGHPGPDGEETASTRGSAGLGVIYG